jgi:hypothetical protein
MSAIGGPGAGGEGVSEKQRSSHPKGSGKKVVAAVTAPSSAHRCGCPPSSKNKKTLAALAAAASRFAGPSTAASLLAGSSWLRSMMPVLQLPAYILAEGWSTLIVPMLAGAEDRLRLPSQFMEAMEVQEMAHAILQECSIG